MYERGKINVDFFFCYLQCRSDQSIKLPIENVSTGKYLIKQRKCLYGGEKQIINTLN